MFGIGLLKKAFGAVKKLKEIEEAVNATKDFFQVGVELERKYRAIDIPGDLREFLRAGKKMADEWRDVV